MWKFLQSDKNGTPAEFENGKQIIMSAGYPPLLSQKCIVYGQKFTIDGLTSGSDDMGINGSSTPVEFYIKADTDNDIYITNISVICGYGTIADLFEFADKGSALTNGVLIAYNHPTEGSITIANPKVNYDFLRMTLMEIVPTAWEMRSLVANNDYGFIVNIPLLKIMPPLGVKLDKGTIQRLSVTIRDDCSTADLFNMRCFGFKRIE